MSRLSHPLNQPQQQQQYHYDNYNGMTRARITSTQPIRMMQQQQERGHPHMNIEQQHMLQYQSYYAGPHPEPPPNVAFMMQQKQQQQQQQHQHIRSDPLMIPRGTNYVGANDVRDSISSTFPTINNSQINKHADGDVPKIELSARQQELLIQRRRQQVQVLPSSDSGVPSFQNLSNTVIGVLQPPPQMFYEPWEKPFIVQTETPQRDTQQSARTQRSKPLSQSVMDHPVHRHHHQSPKVTKLAERLSPVKQSQRNPSTSSLSRTIDPPATKDETTSLSNEQQIQPMETQRAFLRNMLKTKHYKNALPATTASTASSHRSTNSRHKTLSSASPKALLQRVLQTASAMSPKDSKTKQHKRSAQSKYNRPKSNQGTKDSHAQDRNQISTPSRSSPTSFLKDQMRQRFKEKNQHRQVDTDHDNTNDKNKSSSIKVEENLSANDNRQHSSHPVLAEPDIETLNVRVKTPGYEKFVESLMKEVSSHHSQLYASFVVALDPSSCSRDEILQQCALSPKNADHKVDKQTIQRLHEHLQQRCNTSNDMCRSVSQLINDKQYKKEWRSGSSRSNKNDTQPFLDKGQLLSRTKAPPLPDSTTTSTKSNQLPLQRNSNGISVNHRRISEPAIKSQNIKQEIHDEVMQSRSTDSSQTSERQHTNAVQSRLSIEIPTSHSSDSSNDTSPTTSSTTITDTISNGSLPTISVTNTITPATKTEEVSTSWNTTRLRPAVSHDSNDDRSFVKARTTTSSVHPPEWANITLRPVSCRNENMQNDPIPIPVRESNKDTDVQEHLSMDVIMGTENVTMIRLKEDIIVCCDDNSNCRTMESRVVVSQTLLRHIQYDPVDLTVPATVLWTLPRSEMEPDGITINMTTLKVTLLLRNKRLARKVLAFETSSDCVRFTTAFYNISLQSPPLEDHQQPPSTDNVPITEQKPPLEEVPRRPLDHASISSDVNSSVRIISEPLNDEEQVVLEKYRELRQIKPASDALLETMELQNKVSGNNGQQINVEEKVSTKMPSNVDARIGDLPTSPISTFTATTDGEHQQSTEQEKQMIEKYKLMLQRGVPPDAVRHKMSLEQVDPKIASYIFANDNTPENNSASNQNVTKSTTSNELQLSDEDNAIAEKYRKMLKLRIPAEAVRHKMNQDQVDNKIVVAVLGKEHEAQEKQKSVIASDATAKTARSVDTTLSEEEESVAVQYRKLLKINVSKDALLSRMQREGVTPKIIIAILGQNALQSSSSDENHKGGSSGSTGNKMISINWDHTKDAIAGSVWEVWQNADPEPMDFTQLKQMFQRKDMLQKNKQKNDSTNGIGKAKLLDITRSNNIAISLKSFKEFTHVELAEAIHFLDPTRKIRGERTNFIRDLLPTLTEVKIIEEYSGTDDRLVPAELWFRHLRGIKRIERKARVIRTMEMFTSDSVEVRENFRLLAHVCREVMASTKLQDVLGMVLRIGNVMNEGTRNGRAAGFKFHSLLRLTQTKTADGKITLLDYLVSVFVEKGDLDTLDLISDFPDCHKVSRFLISDMTNEVKSLKESMQLCRQELADLENEENPQPLNKNSNNFVAASDPRTQLFASILARATGCAAADDSVPITRKSSDSFPKRDEFLAAIKINKNDVPDDKNHDKDATTELESLNKTFENSLTGGVKRLRKFLELVDCSFARLEKTRDDALQACKDLSRYCGETSGVGVTISLLDVLSQFTKNLEDSVKKYQEQQMNDARKLKLQETKDQHNSKPKEGMQVGNTNDGKSIVLLVNDILKNANPRFKEDFKKGRDIPNPSNKLKMIYEHERKETTIGNLRLDIVSAIQQRADNVHDEDIEKVRSTFAGVQALSDESSPRELVIDPVASFPSPNSQSVDDLSTSMSVQKVSVKQSASMFEPNIGTSTHDSGSSLNINTSTGESKENLQNATPQESASTTAKVNDFSFDIRSSQDRLRTRQSLPSSSTNNRGSLDDVMKSLDEIKKQANSESISETYSSPTKRAQPPRINNETPPIPQNARSVERKSITERARDKRSEKRPNNNTHITASPLTTNSEQPHSHNGSDRIEGNFMIALTNGVSTISSPLVNETSQDAIVKDTAFARLARQKRLQKRISK